MTRPLLWLLLVISLHASSALAEGPCPPGERMVGQQNVPGASFPICQPIPGYSSPAPQPQAVWADRWGAIASDHSGTGANGVAVGKASRSEAIDAAMRDCAAAGGKHCELSLDYHNQCAAMAWGPGNGNGGKQTFTGDPYREGAEKRAVANCEKESGAACKIFYSDCSYAERVPL